MKSYHSNLMRQPIYHFQTFPCILVLSVNSPYKKKIILVTYMLFPQKTMALKSMFCRLLLNRHKSSALLSRQNVGVSRGQRLGANVVARTSPDDPYKPLASLVHSFDVLVRLIKRGAVKTTCHCGYM